MHLIFLQKKLRTNTKTLKYLCSRSGNASLVSTAIGELWLYKVELLVLPFGSTVALTLVISLLYDWWDMARDDCRNYLLCLCKVIIFILLGSFMASFAVLIVCIVFEIAIFLFVAFYFTRVYTSRFPTEHARNLNAWKRVIDWIYENKGYDISDLMDDIESDKYIENKDIYDTPYSCTSAQDRMIRICCINYAYLKGYQAFTYSNGSVGSVDIPLRDYLSGKQKKSFVDVIKLNHLKSHSSKRDSISFFKRFWHIYGALWREINSNIEFYRVSVEQYRAFAERNRMQNRLKWFPYARIGIAFVTFVLGPLYFASRVLSLLFPIIIVIYLNENDLLFEVDSLQWLMFGCYLSLVLILCVLLAFMSYYAYYESFILPSNDTFPSLHPFYDEFVTYVEDCSYPQLIIAPIRDYLVLNVFGKDVGGIVLSYLDEFSLDSKGSFLDFLEKLGKYDRSKHDKYEPGKMYQKIDIEPAREFMNDIPEIPANVFVFDS